MNSISIISTQLQLINCVEYIKAHQLKDNVLFVYACSKKRQHQIKYLLNTEIYRQIFDRVYYIPQWMYINSYLYILWDKLLSFLLLKHPKYSNVIIGNYIHIVHKYFMLRSFLKNNNINCVIVDDGMLSLSYPNIREHELKTRKVNLDYNTSRFINKLYADDYSRLIDISYTFYTSYLKFINNHDKIEKNVMNYLNDNSNKISDIQEIKQVKNIIIGQPFVDLDILSKEDYEKVLTFIINTTNDNNAIYVCHPAEKKLPSTAIRKLSFSLPFECLVYILNEDCNLWGITTSALINAKNIRPCLDVYSVNILAMLKQEFPHYDT